MHYVIILFLAIIGVLDLISGGSRSTTPTSSLLTRKSPTMDQGIQVGHEQQSQQQNNIGKMNDKSNMRTVQPPRREHDRYLTQVIIHIFYSKLYVYVYKILCCYNENLNLLEITIVKIV